MISAIILSALLLGGEIGTVEAAPSSGPTYAPYYVDCPSDIQLVRNAHHLSNNEAEWVNGRKQVASKAFADYLCRLNLTDFDVDKYISKIQDHSGRDMPVLAFANSGGAWRSAFTGTGGLRALDGKNEAAVKQKTGGLLQSMTYHAGLSGGAWVPSSYAFNNYPSVDDMVATWHVDVNRFDATSDGPYAATAATYFKQIAPKFAQGFNLSTEDFLGRCYAYEFLPPGTTGGLDLTWSSITQLSNFKNFEGPMPILQANSLNKNSIVEEGLYVPYQNSTIYEWNPFEFGSWNVGFTPTKYVGTVPDQNGHAKKCVQNLDQASFVMSSAAAAFNYWWVDYASNGSLGQFSKRSSSYSETSLSRRDIENGAFAQTLGELVEYFGKAFNLSLSQIANPSVPNPFGGSENITLADGSEAGQSIPFWSLIQPERDVDFIIAWDDDNDDNPYGWNNGTNMYNTYTLAKTAGLPFPAAPPPSTFLARNYTLKPTLFGCNSSLTTTGDSRSPIVLYMTNAPYSWYSNFSALTFNMSHAEFEGILTNSFNFVTQGNGTLDGEGDVAWVECMGCAAIDRSLERVGMKRTSQCEQCFQKHCWDGTESDLPKDFVFNPSLQLDPGLGFTQWAKTHPFSGLG